MDFTRVPNIFLAHGDFMMINLMLGTELQCIKLCKILEKQAKETQTHTHTKSKHGEPNTSK